MTDGAVAAGEDTYVFFDNLPSPSRMRLGEGKKGREDEAEGKQGDEDGEEEEEEVSGNPLNLVLKIVGLMK